LRSLPVFPNLYFVMYHHAEGGFQQHFERLKPYWNTSARCWRMTVEIKFNGLTTWHIDYQNHPFCIPKNKKQWSLLSLLRR
jgi:hypothetical protein